MKGFESFFGTGMTTPCPKASGTTPHTSKALKSNDK